MSVRARRRRGWRAALAVGAFAWLATHGLVWIQAQAQDPNLSPCVLAVGKWADPTTLWLGERTTVYLTTTTVCPPEPVPIHAVIAIDASKSMDTEGKLDAAKKAAAQFVDRMDLGVSKVGVVSFSDRGYRETDLTNQRARITGAINGLRTRFGTAIEDGILIAHDMLRRARTTRRRQNLPDPIEVILLLSDGRPFPVGQNVAGAARRAKNDGVLLATVCAGTDCDAALMRSCATRPDLFFTVRNPAGYRAIFDRIAGQLLDTNLRRMVITDSLPANMAYLTDTANISPSAFTDHTLAWQLDAVPSSGITISYDVLPGEVGWWPTNLEAVVRITDTFNRRGWAVFPVPTVLVRAPPTPTPTPSPTPTSTPSPTPSPTLPPPSATPTPTDTPRPLPTPSPRPPAGPIFLPLVLNEHCDPTQRALDVVLVIDVSFSMDEPTRQGGPAKREAARDAAERFASLLRVGVDRAGLVSFGDEAEVLAPLDADVAMLRAALAQLPRRAGTRIDAGLRAGAAELTGDPPTSNRERALLLLTDGIPTRSTEEEILAVARAIRETGITVYVVGLGDQVQPELLRGIAGDAARYLEAPEAGDLAALYGRLAPLLPCPSGRHDWGRPWP